MHHLNMRSVIFILIVKLVVNTDICQLCYQTDDIRVNTNEEISFNHALLNLF